MTSTKTSDAPKKEKAQAKAPSAAKRLTSRGGVLAKARVGKLGEHADKSYIVSGASGAYVRVNISNRRTGQNPRTRDQVIKVYKEKFSSFLGQPEKTNELALVQIIHNRLSTSVVQKFLDLGLAWPEMEKILMPRRTFTHRITNNEPLTVGESDRAVRMARVLAMAESVFDNKDKAMRWLRKSMKRFNGNTPIEMMDTDTGSRMVEEALTQMDEGFFA